MTCWECLLSATSCLKLSLCLNSQQPWRGKYDDHPLLTRKEMETQRLALVLGFFFPKYEFLLLLFSMYRLCTQLVNLPISEYL